MCAHRRASRACRRSKAPSAALDAALGGRAPQRREQGPRSLSASEGDARVLRHSARHDRRRDLARRRAGTRRSWRRCCAIAARYYAAHYGSKPSFPYQSREMETFAAKLASAPAVYDKVTVTRSNSSRTSSRSRRRFRRSRRDVPQRAQLVPRRLRPAECAPSSRSRRCSTALKPGGVLGVVDHRWPDPDDRGSARAQRLHLRAARRRVCRGRGLRARRRLGRQQQSAGHARLSRRGLDVAAGSRARRARPRQVSRDRRVGPLHVEVREARVTAARRRQAERPLADSNARVLGGQRWHIDRLAIIVWLLIGRGGSARDQFAGAIRRRARRAARRARSQVVGRRGRRRDQASAAPVRLLRRQGDVGGRRGSLRRPTPSRTIRPAPTSATTASASIST